MITTRHNLGVASVLAMVFLVIFSALAVSMGIVAQGNLATASTYLSVNRSLAASETGMKYFAYRMNAIAGTITTPAGAIDS